MDVEKAAMDIFLPVLESAMIYAGHYCKACGRKTVTSIDMAYGWRYAARTTTGNKLGSFFPEIYEDEEDSSIELDDDDSSIELENSDEPEDDEFTRYEGTEDEVCVKMNEVYDTWNSWEPYSPAEQAIKNAIDSSDGRIFQN